MEKRRSSPARRLLTAGACAATLLAAATGTSVHAATLSGDLRATLTLTTGCLVVGVPGSTTNIDFGVLDFGLRPSTFTGTITAVPSGGASGAGNTQVVCSPDVTGLSIAVDGGSHPGQGAGIGVGTRAMRNGTAYVPYEVYRDAGRTVAYPSGSAVTGFAIPSDGSAFDLPIYGQVNKTSATALPSGVYSDTLVVTLTF